MPNLYMGRGGLDGLFGSVKPIITGPDQGATPIGKPRQPIGKPIVTGPYGTGGVPPAPTAPPGSVLPAQSVTASGPSKGYDPAFLQNLATSIGGLFARPQGNLSFNPLGNLSEISPTSGIGGSAPTFGEPLTWLQQALNGLGFSWQPPAPPTVPGIGSNGGGNGNDNTRGRGRATNFL
jgi:hypothetical protein